MSGKFSGFEACDVLGSNRLDRIVGGSGGDTLNGGFGGDLLRGGAGVDLLIGGGSEQDWLVFANLSDFTAGRPATTADFGFGGGADLIGLTAIDANAATPENDAFGYVGLAAFTAAGQIRVAQDGVDAIVQINATGIGLAEMEIRLANFDAATLTAADFSF